MALEKDPGFLSFSLGSLGERDRIYLNTALFDSGLRTVNSYVMYNYMKNLFHVIPKI